MVVASTAVPKHLPMRKGDREPPQMARPRPSVMLRTRAGSLHVQTIATDLDRTLTDAGLRVVGGALESLRQARARGVRTILLTGRSEKELRRRGRLLESFDAYVAESGAILGQDGEFHPLVAGGPRWTSFLYWLEAAAIPHRAGQACVSIRADLLKRVQGGARRFGVAIHRNRDRIDVTPGACDKGTGLLAALGRLGAEARSCLVFGDAENDLPAFREAGYCVAVGNAEPRLKQAAEEVAPGYGGRAVANFLRRRVLGDQDP